MTSTPFPNLLAGLTIAATGIVGMSATRRRQHLPMDGNPVVIIGITGTIGAGKGTVVDHLKGEPYRFGHYSARALLYEILDAQKLPRNRDNLRRVANEFRAKRGPAAVAVELFSRARRVGKNAVVESLRTEGEIKMLRELGVPFVLLAVDADAKIRYNRIVERGSKTDGVSFETFVEQERKEMESRDPNKQNLKRCMELADFTVRNDADVASFKKHIDRIMSDLETKTGVVVFSEKKRVRLAKSAESDTKATRGSRNEPQPQHRKKGKVRIHIDRNQKVTYRLG